MTVRELLVDATGELERAGVPSPRVDAEWLLAHALGVSRSQLYTNGEEAPAEKTRLFRELVARRARREPLAYVLGEWGFRRLTLLVDPRVLIPRPETEALVDQPVEFLRRYSRWKIHWTRLRLLLPPGRILFTRHISPR